MFAAAVTTFETLRKDRLRAAPLDDSRMEVVRRHMTEAVLASGPTVACFQGYSIRRRLADQVVPTEFEFGTMDKGIFTGPVMSSLNFNDLPPMFVEAVHIALANPLWQELYQRATRSVAVDISARTEPFWRLVIEEAQGAETAVSSH
jgi:hypothetical protein